MSHFDALKIIQAKRDGRELSSDEIEGLVRAYTDDGIPDYQMSAFLMAGFLRGFTPAETAALTRSMLHSGTVVDLSAIPGVKVDKHSTGGVGDKTSLLIAPIAAACGVPVPMISGRGLGHTGGTLDKLESIPGFSVQADLARYREILARQGAVLIGQTAEIAPADKRLYALRDVTGTVESISYISSSIMSKKLAEGIDALVLDVKSGSGAFMRDETKAVELARTLVGIGEDMGKRTIAYITDMNQPLGHAVGNWLEVVEVMDCLQGGGPEDLNTLSHLLAGTMIWLGGKAGDLEEGIARSKECVSSGAALERWLAIVREQGGDVKPLLDPASYPHAAKEQIGIRAPETGYLASMDVFEMGMASVQLGAGRRVKEDAVDPGVGYVLHRKLGEHVKKGETIITLHTNHDAASVSDRLLNAIRFSQTPPDVPALVRTVIDRDGVRPF